MLQASCHSGDSRARASQAHDRATVFPGVGGVRARLVASGLRPLTHMAGQFPHLGVMPCPARLLRPACGDWTINGAVLESPRRSQHDVSRSSSAPCRGMCSDESRAATGRTSPFCLYLGQRRLLRFHSQANSVSADGSARLGCCLCCCCRSSARCCCRDCSRRACCCRKDCSRCSSCRAS